MKIYLEKDVYDSDINKSMLDFDPDKKIELNNGNYTVDKEKYDPDKKILNEETKLDLGDCLKLFEQSNWDCLDAEGIIESIDNLKDTVAQKLELKNIPDIGYYYEEDFGEFGAFSDSENKIYINCFNLDNGEEMAKTVIHELRHCWQKERIELPEELQTDFDKMLQFNKENYIEPYDNYEAYCCQPIEADARAYTDNMASS